MVATRSCCHLLGLSHWGLERRVGHLPGMPFQEDSGGVVEGGFLLDELFQGVVLEVDLEAEFLKATLRAAGQAG